MENNKATVFKATKWSATAEIVSKLSAPIINIILARILIPEAFGIVATVTMLLSFFDLISEAGFSKFLINHNFISKEQLKSAANISFIIHLCISIIMFLLLIIFRKPVSTFIGDSSLQLLLSVSSLQLIISSLGSVQQALFKRNFDFKPLFISRLILSLTPFLVTIPLALLGCGYWSIIIGSLVSQLLSTIFIFFKSEWKPSLNFDYSEKREMFKYSGWSLVESLSVWLSVWVDTFIVKIFFDSYFLGIYKTSINMVNSILSIFTAALIPVLFSALSRTQNDDLKFKNLFLTVQSLLSYLLFPLGFGLFFYRELATNILLGSNWHDSIFIVGFWSITTVFKMVYSDLNGEVFRAKGKPKVSFLIQLSHLIILIPAIIISSKFGFEQMVITRTLIRFQLVIVSMIVMWLKFGISIPSMLKNTIKPLLYSLAMSVLVFFLKDLFANSLWDLLVIFLAIIVYFSFVLVFSKKDLKNFLNIARSK